MREARGAHVVGAGLAGLAAAIALAEAGRRVTLYEAAPQAGGRCRSYDDPTIGCRIDNGNHLLLSGNRAAASYLRTIGAQDTLGGPGEPFFPFVDLADGARWTLRPGRGRLPFWLFSPGRRVPGTRARDYLALLRLARAEVATTMRDALPPGALSERLLAPLAISALNTPLDMASAGLMAAVLRETLLAGGRACVPLFPRTNLAASLIDPALAWLERRGARVRLGQRIAALDCSAERVQHLITPAGPVAVDPADDVVLAVPPWVAGELLPGLRVPDAYEAILNIHFRAEAPGADAAIRHAGFAALLGGTAEWVFLKPGHISVTVSAANRLVDAPAETIAAMVWPEVAQALAITGEAAAVMPPWRVVKERRATFAATPEQALRRPGPRTALVNLALAGDWTDTGLPATIEGAIRSGRAAASLLLASR